MNDVATPSAHNLSTPYKPVALYYEDADSLEYIRKDVPAVFRRVDEMLTLIFNMQDREQLIGFQIKGFKHFYLQQEGRETLGDFLSLVGLLERVVTAAGGAFFDAYRKEAYERAWKIALEDGVEVRDLPKVAAH